MESAISTSLEQAHKLMNDVSTTESHTAQLESDVKTVYQDLQTIDNDLAISQTINNDLKQLDSALNEAVELLEVVSIIPEIGSEASELKNVISAFKKPVDEALAVQIKWNLLLDQLEMQLEK